MVRGDEGTEVFLAENLEAAAGVREPMTEFVAAHPAVPAHRGPLHGDPAGGGHGEEPSAQETIRFLHELVEELKATGFVADALRRSGQTAPVAPPG